MNILQKKYWESKDANMKEMIGNKDYQHFIEKDTQEVIDLVAPYAKGNVLELACGIGRFTSLLAKISDNVTAVDFIEKFIDENKKLNASFDNIKYIQADVCELESTSDKYDHIFINWLLMNISDEATIQVVDYLRDNVKFGGTIYLRESCFCSSNPNKSIQISNYRSDRYYEELFSSGFEIVDKGNINAYEFHYGNKNQIWWILRRI
ncbi:hypothetical protein VIBNISFn27_p10095 [Vibrio nigripulchritudo SFn27]|uniref:SAM-dependent methyltransferase n=1 Tax=Vibrio nigripulchritudo TaxID=28173 RepID=A0A9P1NJQ4_9VIBR|nr:methyltransferase domain-containing protein [Vibrio nigripulchritudo]CBJ93125.1 Putative SAM-dependent methyltransferase [Vibrio nigripulchritudo]CCN85940.1 hypothetical protein VIBNIBLFn1_p0086 [Vibrio nigripulchritudo BLFn1]CCN91937.1 hypothetical protein VIBNISFn27_p10095 [Vibrio nigripulchritudo SFn27]CCN97737.1 hypothetical protein VIBNIENn2_p0085 [Vibrio nigripulchritudo ENn2]CCO43971.1 hypothetical protein VIBNISFn135_p10095 [Vibrio nigripulchritudo SFn135]